MNTRIYIRVPYAMSSWLLLLVDPLWVVEAARVHTPDRSISVLEHRSLTLSFEHSEFAACRFSLPFSVSRPCTQTRSFSPSLYLCDAPRAWTFVHSAVCTSFTRFSAVYVDSRTSLYLILDSLDSRYICTNKYALCRIMFERGLSLDPIFQQSEIFSTFYFS